MYNLCTYFVSLLYLGSRSQNTFVYKVIFPWKNHEKPWKSTFSSFGPRKSQIQAMANGLTWKTRFSGKKGPKRHVHTGAGHVFDVFQIDQKTDLKISMFKNWKLKNSLHHFFDPRPDFQGPGRFFGVPRKKSVFHFSKNFSKYATCLRLFFSKLKNRKNTENFLSKVPRNPEKSEKTLFLTFSWLPWRDGRRLGLVPETQKLSKNWKIPKPGLQGL